MAHHKSAKKRIVRNAKRATINRTRVSRLRTFVKKVELAIASGNAEEARAAFQAVTPELQRGVGKGIVHKNAASRKLSRLSARIKALG